MVFHSTNSSTSGSTVCIQPPQYTGICVETYTIKQRVERTSCFLEWLEGQETGWKTLQSMKSCASIKDHYLYLIVFNTSRTNNILLSSAFNSQMKLHIVGSLGNLRSTESCLCLWLSRTMLPPLSLELLFWRVTLAGTFGTETGAGVEGGSGTGTGAGVGGGDGAEGVSVGLGPYSILCFYKKTNNSCEIAKI